MNMLEEMSRNIQIEAAQYLISCVCRKHPLQANPSKTDTGMEEESPASRMDLKSITAKPDTSDFYYGMPIMPRRRWWIATLSFDIVQLLPNRPLPTMSRTTQRYTMLISRSCFLAVDDSLAELGAKRPLLESVAIEVPDPVAH
ncbi:hypothetical protein BU15DRAFT_64890 [Melanogaster broomeanus]|nr:hypothetical protein BU15DRAFT_64890 [Melanogaster broomeanus]